MNEQAQQAYNSVCAMAELTGAFYKTLRNQKLSVNQSLTLTKTFIMAQFSSKPSEEE